MKGTRKLALGVGAALSLGLAAAVVSAHPYGYGPGAGMGSGHGMGWGMGPGAGGMGPMGYGMGPGRMGSGNPTAAAEGRLAYLKSTLQITPAQETAWQAFAAKAKQQVEGRTARMGAMRDAGTTAPDRLAKRAEIMKQNVAEMETMSAALKDLYGVLTPEQRAIADRGFGGQGPGRGFRGGPGARRG